MKKYLRKLVALALFAMALTGAALAQDSAHVFRANIPFSFYAGGKLLPAGEYTIPVNLEDQRSLSARGQPETSFLLGSSEESSRDERTILTFTLVDGEGYALRELTGS